MYYNTLKLWYCKARRKNISMVDYVQTSYVLYLLCLFLGFSKRIRHCLFELGFEFCCSNIFYFGLPSHFISRVQN